MKLKVPKKYQAQIIELLACIIKEIWEKENGGNDESSQNQVKNHVESQTYQYNLRDYAYKLGFKKVNVIDEDLGKSGGGSVKRDGFEKLLQAVCKGEVGAILAFEASRLARNGREWHTLLELCGLIDTLIIDPEGIYDPRLPNDRLLL